MCVCVCACVCCIHTHRCARIFHCFVCTFSWLRQQDFAHLVTWAPFACHAKSHCNSWDGAQGRATATATGESIIHWVVCRLLWHSRAGVTQKQDGSTVEPCAHIINIPGGTISWQICRKLMRDGGFVVAIFLGHPCGNLHYQMYNFTGQNTWSSAPPI